MNREMKTATVTFLALMSLIGTLFAAYTLWSNTVTVVVGEYNLVLSPTGPLNVPKNINVTFTATLSYSGSPVTGATVNLYRNGNLVGMNTTNNSGQCTFTVNMTQTGTFDFKTSYDVA